MKVNEMRTVVGVIGHCVSPQPWREIDAHGSRYMLLHISSYRISSYLYVFQRNCAVLHLGVTKDWLLGLLF